VADVSAAAEDAGRVVRPIVQRLIIMDDTDELARRRVEEYNSGSDVEALENERNHYALDRSGGSAATKARTINPHKAVDPSDGNLITGSPKTVAETLNRIARVDGLDDVLVLFDDFTEGLDRFGQDVVPLLDFPLSRS
jgi:pyrimidine oxygenase